jgi:tRNA-2-methylthio-N6-dimethylallyladenosine synthase
VRDLPKVMEHIEVPIQAGDDEVLLNMRRGYTSGEYRELYQQIREILPNAVPYTPTSLLASAVNPKHSFRQPAICLPSSSSTRCTWRDTARGREPYRNGAWPTTCPNLRRCVAIKAIEELQEQVSAEINARFLGETVEVLVEDQHKGKWRGRNRQNKLVFIDSPCRCTDVWLRHEILWTGPWSMQARFVRDVSPLTDKVQSPRQTFSISLNQLA